MCFAGDPEKLRDAKGKLEKLMGAAYSETEHQGDFTKRLDLQSAAKRCPSLAYLIEQFRKLVN